HIFHLSITIYLFSDSHLHDNFITGEFVRCILKNENLDEFLYEIDVMISRYINIDSLEAVASGIGEVPEVDPINNPDRYTKFTKIKEIKIINPELFMVSAQVHVFLKQSDFMAFRISKQAKCCE